MVSWDDVEILKIYFTYILKYRWEEQIAIQSCGKINNVLNALSTEMCRFPLIVHRKIFARDQPHSTYTCNNGALFECKISDLKQT